MRQRGLATGFLEQRLDERRRDSEARFLHRPPSAAGQLREAAVCPPELVVEHHPGMPLQGATPQRATTAGWGAGSTARARRGAGLESVNPQNIRAIPTSSPT